jgi:hypothetical protein
MHFIRDVLLIIVIAIIIYGVYIVITKKSTLTMMLCKIPIIGNTICKCPKGYNRTIYDWGNPTTDTTPPCNNGCAGLYKTGQMYNGKQLGTDGFLDNVWGKYPNQCWSCPMNHSCRVNAVPIDQPGSCGECGGIWDTKVDAIKLGANEITSTPIL